jgi:hypothetical protein
MKYCNKCGSINPEAIGMCVIKGCEGILFRPFTLKHHYEIDPVKYVDLYERVLAKVQGIIPMDWFPENYIEDILKQRKEIKAPLGFVKEVG